MQYSWRNRHTHISITVHLYTRFVVCFNNSFKVFTPQQSRHHHKWHPCAGGCVSPTHYAAFCPSLMRAFHNSEAHQYLISPKSLHWHYFSMRTNSKVESIHMLTYIHVHTYNFSSNANKDFIFFAEIYICIELRKY